MIRPLTLLTIVAAAGAGLHVYNTKHAVSLLDRELRAIARDIGEADTRTQALQAEWAWATEQERLRALAQRHLVLEPMQPTQFVRLAEAERRLPPAAAHDGPVALFAPREVSGDDGGHDADRAAAPRDGAEPRRASGRGRRIGAGRRTAALAGDARRRRPGRLGRRCGAAAPGTGRAGAAAVSRNPVAFLPTPVARPAEPRPAEMRAPEPRPAAIEMARAAGPAASAAARLGRRAAGPPRPGSRRRRPHRPRACRPWPWLRWPRRPAPADRGGGFGGAARPGGGDLARLLRVGAGRKLGARHRSCRAAAARGLQRRRCRPSMIHDPLAG
jgi:hypothetical protein